jgi:ribosomal protein L13
MAMKSTLLVNLAVEASNHICEKKNPMFGPLVLTSELCIIEDGQAGLVQVHKQQDKMYYNTSSYIYPVATPSHELPH